MDDLELIFTMLGERATTEIHLVENSQGVPKLQSDAKAGGGIAGGARKKLEKRLKRSTVLRENYLTKPQNKKLLKK
jgi:DNA-damage-inducible protein D